MIRGKGRKADSGFTLVEMMVVLAVIVILATLSMPSNHNREVQLRVVETLELIESYKKQIETVYMSTGVFPKDNDEAGLPEPNMIKGNYLRALYVSDGRLDLEFGQKMAERYHGQILSVRPVFVEAASSVPPSWVCGYDAVPEGMAASGKNGTTMKIEFLPLRCR